MRDSFELLGLPRRPWLEAGEIRRAFQQKARALHPDAAGGDAEAFARLNAAYATLSDPAARARLLAGETPLPTLPEDPRLGFRVGEWIRRADEILSREAEASQPLVRALLASEAREACGEWERLREALDSGKAALDERLRNLDARWPGVDPAELAAWAGEAAFFSRWQDQAGRRWLALRIALPG